MSRPFLTKRRLVILAALAFVVALSLSWVFGSVVTGRSAVPPSPLPAGAQAVSLRSADGITLAGNFWPGKDDHAPAILMLHGLGSSRAQFDGDGAALAKKGYAVLAINFRAHGDSGGDLRSFGLFEARDAQAGFAWLKGHQHQAKVGIVGMSLGGAAALLGPKGPVKCDALVLAVVYPDIHHAIRNRVASKIGGFLGAVGELVLSYQAPLRYGVWPDAISPVTAIRELHAPVLVIGGEADVYTPPAETRMLFNAAPGPKQLWIVPKAGHNGATKHPEFLPRVAAFFDKALR